MKKKHTSGGKSIQSLFLSLKRCLYRRRFRRFVKAPRRRNQRYRFQNIFELCSTELTYNLQLGFCVKNLIKASKEDGILTDDERKNIFSNYEQIWMISSTLLERLVLDSEKIPMLNNFGEIFLGIVPFYKLYKNYIYSYAFTSSNYCERIIMKKPKVGDWFEGEKNQTERYCRDYSVLDFLVLPLGRVPRYRLLLRNILRHTHKSHREYDEIKKCVDKLDEICKEINEMRRKRIKQEELEKLRKVMTKDDAFSIIDHPRRKYKEKTNYCHLFCEKLGIVDFVVGIIYLFNDLILFMKNSAFKKEKESTPKPTSDNCIIIRLENIVETKLIKFREFEETLISLTLLDKYGERMEFCLILDLYRTWLGKIEDAKKEHEEFLDEEMKIPNMDRKERVYYVLEKMKEYVVDVNLSSEVHLSTLKILALV